MYECILYSDYMPKLATIEHKSTFVTVVNVKRLRKYCIYPSAMSTVQNLLNSVYMQETVSVY
jgi:hypothetical protein